jgi:uncharacterized C2H2 Zn-finger protein
MTNALLKCIKCNDIFRTRHDLEYHVKRDHQSSVKVKFQNGDVTEVKRAEDNTFKCKCGKSFKLPDSLRRHARTCRGELTDPEQIEREPELMDVDGSDASESLDLDDRVVPVDCFGAVISHEKC